MIETPISQDLKRLPLSYEELTKALSLFADCQKVALSKLDEKALAVVIKWISDSILLSSPHYSLRADAIQKRIDDVFGNEDIREFVFELGFMFFSQIGVPDANWRLAANLAEGLSMDGFDTSVSAIPDNVLASMSNVNLTELIEPLTFLERFMGHKPKDLQWFLASNKHMLVEYMLYLANIDTTA